MNLSKKWFYFLSGVILVAMVITVYSPAINGGFIWDDDGYIIDNNTLRSLDGLREIWLDEKASPQYYPLVFTSFWVEYNLWQLNPFGYHLNNVILHALGAILIWSILHYLSIPGAFLSASIFALHPVHVESVAWITERKNVLSGVFYLSALLMYLRFSNLDVPLIDNKRQRKWVFYILSLSLFLCALLSKTVTASLPAVILLILWWKHNTLSWKDFVLLAPFFAIGIKMGLKTSWLEKYRVGAHGGEEWMLSFADRFLIAGRALWFYAQKLLLPYKLTFIYPRWQVDSQALWQYIYPVSALLVILILLCLYWFKHIGKAPIIAILIFAGTLFPVLGFFNVFPFTYSYVADHFQYLASISLIVLFSVFIDKILMIKDSKAINILCYVLIIGTIGALTWKQSHIYKDLDTLWRDTIRKNPSAWLAHNNLGVMRGKEGKIDQAITHYYKALQINPNYALAHNNMGEALVSKGRINEAYTHFNEALRISPDSDTHNGLGAIMTYQGKFQEAIFHYTQALRFDPENIMALNNIAIIFVEQGKIEEAIKQYYKVLRVKPDFAEVHFNLGNALIRNRKIEEAIKHYSIALQIKPDFSQARYKLNSALQKKTNLN